MIGTVAMVVIAVAVAAVALVLIPLAKQEKEAAVWEEILDQVQVYVQAAEMLYTEGSARLEYVLKMMNIWLAEMKYAVDSDRLRALIESAVYSLPGREEGEPASPEKDNDPDYQTTPDIPDGEYLDDPFLDDGIFLETEDPGETGDPAATPESLSESPETALESTEEPGNAEIPDGQETQPESPTEGPESNTVNPPAENAQPENPPAEVPAEKAPEEAQESAQNGPEAQEDAGEGKDTPPAEKSAEGPVSPKEAEAK